MKKPCSRQNGKSSGAFKALTVMGVIMALAAFLPSCSRHDDVNRDLDAHGLTKRAAQILGINPLAPDNPLVLIPVATGEEPFLMAYSVPVHSDVGTNHCALELVDNGVLYSHEFIRQTNGTYLVYWNTTFVTYGSHALQVALLMPPRSEVYGVKRIEIVTNLIRFDPGSTSFGTRVSIDGILHVDAADYRIEIYDTTNNLLKTITGHTDKRAIGEVWNLTTTNGQIRTDQEFTAKVYIRPTATNGFSAEGSNATPFCGPYPLSLLRQGAGGLD